MQRRIIATSTVLGSSLLLIGVAAAAVGGSKDKATNSSVITVVPAAASQSATFPTPTLTATPAVAAAAASAITPSSASTTNDAQRLRKLPPLDLSDMRLWNWSAKWVGSEWSNAAAAVGWKYDHIEQVANGNTRLTLDANGAPELQAGTGTAAAPRGLWETEVTLPTMRPGLVVAPLWLYDPASKDEVDFEFAGRNGLTVSLHGSANGQTRSVTVPVLAGIDMSGQKHRFGIKVDEAFGYVQMYVDGQSVYRWDRSTTPFFIFHPLRPWIEMWPTTPSNAGLVAWTGLWQAMGKHDSEVMIVHGYDFTPLP